MRRRPARRPIPKALVGCAIAAAVVGGLGGCYTRVVNEKPGLGRADPQVYQSNLERSRVPVIDNFLDYALDQDTKPRKTTKPKPKPKTTQPPR